MNIPFLQLGQDDRSAILQSAAAELNMTAQVLEKDVWVCWALGKLFAMPNAKPKAFKGGTSLSKIWNVISRFSEDIDVTIDYRSFDIGFDHTKDPVSSNRRTQISEELRERVKQYTKSTVMPWLNNQLYEELQSNGYKLTCSEDGEKIMLDYPSAISEKNDYIRDSVLLEFGGRNTLEPNDKHKVTTYLSQAKNIQGIDFPEANDIVTIDVLRTFWEKVTLIHERCGKPPQNVKAVRLSRHWYDLHMLVGGNCIDINAALKDDAVLREVVALKNVFFYSGSAKYASCLEGNMILTPDDDLLGRIAEDYDEMRNMNLVVGKPPSFDEILKSIGLIQKTVNHHYSKSG